MDESGSAALLIAFVVTWSIGLLPPVLIRYMVLRQPMERGPAIGACIGLWAFNLILFTMLGSQSRTHSAISLIAFVSFWILRSGAKPQIGRSS